jgi:hypothetical protein
MRNELVASSESCIQASHIVVSIDRNGGACRASLVRLDAKRATTR